MLTSAIVPHRPDGGHRDAAWAWNWARWRLCLPDVEVVVASDDGGANPGEFNHPLAINRGVDQATGDVLVVADADTAFDPEWVSQAAALVADGAPWVLPSHYRKLTEDATEELLGKSPRWRHLDTLETEWIGEDVSVSGLVVTTRDNFVKVGGYDERFTSWGADDVCFAAAMDTLCGPAVRLAGSAWHCWHPTPLGETYGHDDHRRQHALMERYLRARGDARSIRQLVDSR